MKNYEKSEPLLSIHIPKCGGTSLKAILKKWYGNNLLSHYYDERKGVMPKKYKLKTWYSEKYKGDLCIHGHFNKKRLFGISDYYPEVKQAFTFVRDPLEIALSVFHYNLKLQKNEKNYRDGKKMIVSNDLDEFLENSNSYIRFFLPEKINIENIDNYFENYFIHVGIMEFYQESIDILADKLNKPKIVIPRDNISKRTQNPSQSSILKFKNKCEFEYAFYNRALQEHNIKID